MKFKLNISKPKSKFIKIENTTNVGLYWRYILMSTFVLVGLACILGVYVFLGTEKIVDLPDIKVADQGESKKEKVAELLDYFDNKDSKSLNILNSPSPVIDPSL